MWSYIVVILCVSTSFLVPGCKKNGEGISCGSIFTRSRKKIETAVVSSQTEMREIIELATNKRVIKFFEEHEIIEKYKKEPKKTDSEKYDEQLGGL